MAEQQNDTEITTKIDQICQEVRDISHQMLPTNIALTGFQQSIRELIENTPINCHLQFYDFPEDLPKEKQIHCYRIIEESLQNIQKHAYADTVDIQFFGHPDELILSIDDDGIGFDKSNVRLGLGLHNIQTRSENMNAKLTISSQPDLGTNLLIQIPH